MFNIIRINTRTEALLAEIQKKKVTVPGWNLLCKIVFDGSISDNLCNLYKTSLGNIVPMDYIRQHVFGTESRTFFLTYVYTQGRFDQLRMVDARDIMNQGTFQPLEVTRYSLGRL
jgi:hypothetical protein